MLERDFEHRSTTHQRAPRSTAVDIGAQSGETINNVVRDQINYNRMALEIAPMRRKARTLLRTGWTLILLGVAINIAAVVLYMNALSRLADSPTWEVSDMPFEYLVWGAVGSAVGAVGVACAITSVFIRRSARRREERL